MESIPLPSTITITPDTDAAHTASVVIEPLYPGYGPTIANSLRRVLLSSLPGAAIFAFKIKGVSHEFTAIEYVKEDVVDISLNLKLVNIVSHSAEPVELHIKASGEKIVTAGDIEANADIEIANPNQPIMTLTDKAAEIDMTLWVRQGRGYETVETRGDDDALEVNAIGIDSIFTPIVNVGYQIDNVRVGKRTDYDKIIMQVETNGTVTVEDALTAAGKILTEQFSVIADRGLLTPVDTVAMVDDISEQAQPAEEKFDE